MTSARAGYTLAEATTALLVAGVLTLCLAAILATVGRVALRYAQVAGAAETERTVIAILGAELRTLTAADAVFAADSVRLRAFRGVGTVCAANAAELVVDYRGVRLPEYDKDSVLLVWANGELRADVTSIAAAPGCGDGEDVGLRITTDRVLGDASPPALVLVFETGAYSIGGSAFRYRRGAAGRQPLTDQNLFTAGSSLRLVRADPEYATAQVTLRTLEARLAPGLPWRIHMPQGALIPGAPAP
jgi:hypothetical protein